MKKLIPILLTIFCPIAIQAQLVQVSGFIYQKADSSVSIPHASLINKRTRTGTQSTFDGFYTMLVAPGDTVEISMIGYKTTRAALPLGFSGTSFHKNIYLKEEYVILKEHTFNGLTWAKFKQDFEAMEVQKEKVYITMDKQTMDKSPVNATPHLSLNGPISWLYNKLGKKAKEQNKLQELKNGDDIDMEYTRRISNQFVMEATKLPENKVNQFLDFCHSDVAFYANATDYDIKAKFQSCLPEFKAKFMADEVVPENKNINSTDTIKASPR